jgi:predicted nuclease of predicted toxin-antitoxin system
LKFKVDENLPAELAAMLRDADHEADTVGDQKLAGADDSAVFERCQAQGRILLTLDLDFSNVQTYPPKLHAGVVVFRSRTQDKPTLVALLKRLLPLFKNRSPRQQPWIVEHDRVRYRED